jgi:NADH-quinone oxidoreductase subunit E
MKKSYHFRYNSALEAACFYRDFSERLPLLPVHAIAENPMLLETHQSEVERILARYPDGKTRSALIPLLYLAQEAYGAVTKDAIIEIGEILGLEPIHVAEVCGFYTLLMDKPHGRRRVQICTDPACAMRGSEEFAHEVCAHLGIQLGETTPDGEFTVEAVSCLAGCGHAPVFQMQDSSGVQYYESEAADRPMRAEEAVEILRKKAGGKKTE